MAIHEMGPEPPEEDIDDVADENEPEQEGHGEDGEVDLGREEPDEGSDGQDEERQQGQGPARQNEVVVPGRKSRDENFAVLRERQRRDAAEKAEYRERADRLARENEDLKRAQQQMQQREDPRLEAERLALMSPDERMDYQSRKLEGRLNGLEAQHRFQMWDMDDKARYRAQSMVDPRYKRYEAEVETRLVQARQTGINLPREMILQQVIGERVMANKGKVTEQRRAGQAKIEKNTAKPVNARGEPGGRAKSDDRTARARRLENVKL